MRSRKRIRPDRWQYNHLEPRHLLASIANGQELTGGFDAGETETYEFQVSSPGQVQVFVGELASTVASPVISINDAAGNLVETVRAGDRRDNDYRRFEADIGTYSIIVSDARSNDAMDFKIRAIQLSDNPSLIADEDLSLQNGVEEERIIAASALRTFSFDVTAAGFVRFSQAGTIRSATTGFVFDPAGNFISNSVRFDGRGLKQDVDAQPGTYTLAVINTDPVDVEFRTRVTNVVQPYGLNVDRDAMLANGGEVDISFPFGTHSTVSIQVDQPGTVLLSAYVGGSSTTYGDVILLDENGRIVEPEINRHDNADGFYQYQIGQQQTGKLTALISNGYRSISNLERSVRFLSLPETSAEPLDLIENRDQELGIGETVTSSLPLLAPFNLFPIDVTQLTTTRVLLETDHATATPMLRIYSPDGRIVSEDQGDGISPQNRASALFEPTVAGRYYAVVQDGRFNGTADSMSFTLSATSIPNNLILTNSQAISLSNGQESFGTLADGNGSFKTFKFNVASPGWIAAVASELSDSDDSQLAIRIYQPDGTPARSRSPFGGETFFYETTDSSTMLALDALQVGEYTLVVEQVGTDAISEFFVRAFSSRDPIPGSSLVLGDVDLAVNGREYPVTIPVGETILVQFDVDTDVNSQLLVRGSRLEQVQRILSDAGGLNDASISRFFNPSLGEFSTSGSVAMALSNLGSTDATVFVRRVSFNGTPFEQLSHEQQLVNGRLTSLTVPIDSSAFYTVPIETPGPTFVSLGAVSNNFHRQLTIFDPNGHVLESVPASSHGNGFSFIPSMAGDHTIVLTPTSAVPVEYELRVVALLDNPELQSGQDGILYPDSPIVAMTPKAGFSIFQFETFAAGPVSLSVVSGSRPRIEIYDSTGAVVASVQDYGDVTANFVAAEAGQYYAVVDNEVDPPVRPAFSFQIELSSTVVLPENHSTISNGNQLEFSVATGESHVVALDVAAAGPVFLTANTVNFPDQDNLTVQAIGTDGQNIASFSSANGIAGQFLATEAGTYYLQISGNSETGNELVDVRLRTLAVAANVVAPPSSVVPQDGTFEENGDSFNATIPNGSFALMHFYGAANEPIDINVGLNAPGSDFFRLKVIDEAGLTHVDVFGQSSATVESWIPDSDGRYFVMLHSVDAEIANVSVQVFGNVPFPPQVLSIQRNVENPGWLRYPDRVNSLSFQFDKDVEVTNTELMVRNLQTDEVTYVSPSAESYDTETFTVVWTYSDQFDPLEPGNYELTISAASILDQNGFRPLSEDVTTTIYLAIPGDVNLDGRVDVLNDAFVLVENLGNNGEATWSYGDFNGDQITDVLNDAFILVANLGRDINLAPSSALLFGDTEPITFQASSSTPKLTLPAASRTEIAVSLDEEDIPPESNLPLISEVVKMPRLAGHQPTNDIDSVFAERG